MFPSAGALFQPPVPAGFQRTLGAPSRLERTGQSQGVGPAWPSTKRFSHHTKELAYTVELAYTIASTVTGVTHRVKSGPQTVNILQAFLTISTGFQREDAWLEWLKIRLADMASRLPACELSRTLFTHRQELKKVLKLNHRIHLRTEVLATAANE